MKGNYFYIDESGSLFNDDKIFIHGCIKTDTENISQDIIEGLKRRIKKNVYYTSYIEEFNKIGFHATENHPDIRKELYEILPLMNFRAYFIVLNKETKYYRSLKEKKENHEIFEYSLRKLLSKRIRSLNGKSQNHFVFEQISIPKKSLSQILKDIFTNQRKTKYNCSYEIDFDEKEENIAIIDYLNYIIYTILTNGNFKKKMEENFDIIKEKIGFINFMHNDTFLSRHGNNKQQINLKNLIDYYSGN